MIKEQLELAESVPIFCNHEWDEHVCYLDTNSEEEDHVCGYCYEGWDHD